MNQPKISVIMSVLNGEKFVEESLKSILKQDNIAHLEIVCVDGGSKDRTLDILKEYQSSFPQIQIYPQDRPGIGAAKNIGIEKSKGRYVTFLDADDFYIDPTALRKLHEASQLHEVSVVGGYRQELFQDGEVKPLDLHREFCEGYPQGRLFQYRDVQYDYHFHSYIYEREMLVKNGAWFRESFCYDDTHFFIRALLAAQKFYIVPVELYCYRCGPGYDWEYFRTSQALDGLTDQLKFSCENKLEILHWLTIHRLNHEYGRMFKKHLLTGRVDLLKRLLETNALLDSGMIDRVQSNFPSRAIHHPMLHMSEQDLILRRVQNPEGSEYVLEAVQFIFREMEMNRDLQFLQKKVPEFPMNTTSGDSTFHDKNFRKFGVRFRNVLNFYFKNGFFATMTKIAKKFQQKVF